MKSVPHQLFSNLTKVVVLQFCQQVLCDFREELRKRQIRVDLDADGSLVAEIPCAIVRPALQRIIEDACRHTPDGETLDITVLQGPHSIEIEVADARYLGPSSSQDHRRLLLGNTVIARAISKGVTVETLPCPQGGLARTLVIPLSDDGQRGIRVAA